MPSKIDSNLKMTIDQFTPDILGVFWITDEELGAELLGFEEFNYLFDGLISQYIYGQAETILEKHSKKHLGKLNVFFTKNFNQKLFLAHFKMQDEISSVLDDQMTLIQENKNDERKKILLFNQTQMDWSSDLKKRYPKFEFIDLLFSKN